MSQFVLDTFTGTDADNLTIDPAGSNVQHVGETGATWTGGSNLWLLSNRVYGLPNGMAYASGVPASTEYDVTIPIFVKSLVGDVGVVARLDTGTLTTYYLAWYEFGNARWALWKNVAGTFTLLGSFGQTLTVGQTYTLKLQVREAAKKVFVDGVERISSTDNTITAAGRVGISLDGGGAAISGHVESFTADDVAAPAVSAGTASYSSATASAITVTHSAASGGTAPITVQWQRSASPTSGFANLSGATTDTWTDTTPTAGVTYFYRVIATDAAAQTATSNYAVGRTTVTPTPFISASTVRMGFVGTSITAGFNNTTSPPSLLKASLEADGRSVTISNQGQAGSQTSDWQSGGTYANNALVAFGSVLQAGDYVHVELGTNDGANRVTAATFQTRLTNVIGWITGAGYKTILSYSLWMKTGLTANYDDTADDLLIQYQAVIDGLVNGTTVRQGDRAAFVYFAQHPSELSATDGVHTTDTGAASLAAMWKAATFTATSSVVASRRSGLSRTGSRTAFN
jgi:lysophospholipase L1-like esterase